MKTGNKHSLVFLTVGEPVLLSGNHRCSLAFLKIHLLIFYLGYL